MELLRKGKVRDIYDLGDNLVLVTSDRVSASDMVLPYQVPNKGIVLNRLSAFWFDFTQNIIRNHKISIDNADMPKEFQTEKFEGRCMLVKKLKMIPIECIVRGYITGSSWESYKENGTVCGIELPKGLRECEKLPKPIYTPTTKSTDGNDEHVSFEKTGTIIYNSLWPESSLIMNAANSILIASWLKDISIALYEKCAEYAKTKGVIIADTKFEFGINEKGQLMLADEILTPDNSRFWLMDEYEVGKPQRSYQYLREWIKNSGWDKNLPAPTIPEDVIEITSKKYVEAFEKLTGTNF